MYYSLRSNKHQQFLTFWAFSKSFMKQQRIHTSGTPTSRRMKAVQNKNILKFKIGYFFFSSLRKKSDLNIPQSCMCMTCTHAPPPGNILNDVTKTCSAHLNPLQLIISTIYAKDYKLICNSVHFVTPPPPDPSIALSTTLFSNDVTL